VRSTRLELARQGFATPRFQLLVLFKRLDRRCFSPRPVTFRRFWLAVLTRILHRRAHIIADAVSPLRTCFSRRLDTAIGRFMRAAADNSRCIGQLLQPGAASETAGIIIFFMVFPFPKDL